VKRGEMGPSVSYRTFIAGAANCIRAYCGGDADPRCLNRLIDLAATTVQAAMPGRLRIAADTQATSTSTLSTSLVSSLFAANGPDSPLRHAVDRPGDIDDLGIFQLFRKTVVQAASNELFHRWAEYDPYSARLWRNLHRAIRQDDRLVTFPAGHPRWVALAGDNGVSSDRMSIGYADLASILVNIDLRQSKLGDIVFEVLSHAADIEGFCGAIAIDKLFAALREVSSQLAASELHESGGHCDEDPVSCIALGRALSNARRETHVKLHQYSRKCKLTGDEYACFETALDNLLSDCADGGQAQSYFRYLQAYWSDLTPARYAEIYRTRFEYLANSAKQQLREAAANETA
jgi:hypothetical protein